MTPRLIALAAFSIATIAAPASAEVTIKPGLYQVTSKLGGDHPMSKMMAQLSPQERQQMQDATKQMQKSMSQMTPAQRKAMNDAMAKQGGGSNAIEAMQSMQMSTNADGTTTMKMCMTKEMIDQSKFGGQHGNCQHNQGKFVGGVMKFSVSCTKPAGTGKGEVRITGPNSYATKMEMASAQGTMLVESTSTWLGANCGSVKPLTYKDVARK